MLAVRHWSLGDMTRVSVEVSGQFTVTTDHLHNPERVYFDLPNVRPSINSKRLYTEQIDDKLVSRIRVAETQPGVTRVVLDLTGPVEVTHSELVKPDRLMIEVRGAKAVPAPEKAPEKAAEKTAEKAQPVNRVFVPKPALVQGAPQQPQTLPEPPKAEMAVVSKPAPKLPAVNDVPEPPAAEPAKGQLGTAADVAANANSHPVVTLAALPENLPHLGDGESAKPARRTTDGDTSLVRALGLKVARVVIDPGHGGHDEGTRGPKGLQEKELVLDVSKRVGKLIEERLGAEVVYTRSDDTFIPLEGRTAFANEKKADLFLSIHANSSPMSKISGVEVYYLNFPDSKDAAEVASRENASSQKSIFDLREIIQKITLHDKAEESREFAGRIQSSLFTFEQKNFPATKNRGVKKAPFIVLIGANMPSVLAEIGFVSNPHEEMLLKRPEYRQKLAESLFRGVAKYAEGLSHFQVAQTPGSTVANVSKKPESRD